MRTLALICWGLCGLAFLAGIVASVFGSPVWGWFISAVLFAAAATAYAGA